MRKILKKAVLCAAMAVLVWGGISVLPQKAMADEQACDNYVYDYMDLLTDREENKLNEYIKEYADNGMPVFIVTQKVVGGSLDIEQETCDISELFYKDTVKGTYGIADALVITTCYQYKSADSSQYYDRYADVSGQGNFKFIFSDYDCENIFNSALSYFKAENFLDAYVQMIAYADEIKSGSGNTYPGYGYDDNYKDNYYDDKYYDDYYNDNRTRDIKSRLLSSEVTPKS